MVAGTQLSLAYLPSSSSTLAAWTATESCQSARFIAYSNALQLSRWAFLGSQQSCGAVRLTRTVSKAYKQHSTSSIALHNQLLDLMSSALASKHGLMHSTMLALSGGYWVILVYAALTRMPHLVLRESEVLLSQTKHLFRTWSAILVGCSDAHQQLCSAGCL